MIQLFPLTDARHAFDHGRFWKVQLQKVCDVLYRACIVHLGMGGPDCDAVLLAGALP